MNDWKNHPDWQGPTCQMCGGTGEYFAMSGEPMRLLPNGEVQSGTPMRRDVPTGLRCPSCNGHGRDPS